MTNNNNTTNSNQSARTNLLECISNAISWNESSAIENLQQYSSEELIEECERFDIAVSSNLPKSDLIALLIAESKQRYNCNKQPENKQKETVDDICVKYAGRLYEVVYICQLDVSLITTYINEDEPMQLVNYYYGDPTAEDTISMLKHQQSTVSSRIMIAIARQEHQQDITVKYVDSETAAALTKICELQNFGMPQLLESFVDNHDQYVLDYAYTDDADDTARLLKIMSEHSVV